ncbi:MAG: hypothetical protein SNJ67_01580 [Chloracidobacterium sp.]|uniref:Glycosyltransferase RgtA/B/C/D-like domain-containing protein n=1 Tax=Chloracidobacterium validum TaxID=2821543 RepID=A0ABX8B968_9BACT|nr:hypothetical protein [Chloracidobacterium validum]QUW03214.1 hypothetical protein J8C06_01880 [Chloracidobacterium validum]
MKHGLGWIAVGLFLLVGAVYVLASPGRIDMIDGQCRYEVARSLVEIGQPTLRDPMLQWIAVRGRDGRPYSHYGLGASATGAPLVALGKLGNDWKGEQQRFLFSLTSAVFGAGLASVLFLFFLDLGVSPGRAVLWTLVNAFATLTFIGATTTFDNIQQAFFVLGAAWLAYRSAQRQSLGYAVAGGLCAGWLVNFVEHLILLWPCLALMCSRVSITWPPLVGDVRPWLAQLWTAFWRTTAGRASLQRIVAFSAACGVGLLIFGLYNLLRFGHPLNTGKFAIPGHPSFWGNPLYGIPGLLLSPGKGVLWYSPPIILAIFGYAGLRNRAPLVARLTLLASVVLVGFVGCISFYGGDWCWGPRYLLPVLPLWSLTLAFLPRHTFARWATAVVVVAGLGVQGLGLSLDHQRFFLERCLPPHFWATDPGFNFRESALLARPFELLDPVNPSARDKACWFRPGPYDDTNTYCLFGLAPEWADDSPLWALNFEVFYVGRPWIIWMPRQPRERQPIPIRWWLFGTLTAGAIGCGLLTYGLRAKTEE